MKAPPSRFSAASTTGCRPPTMRKARLSSTTRPGPAVAPPPARRGAAATSRTASASAAAAIGPACGHDRAGERLEDGELERRAPARRRWRCAASRPPSSTRREAHGVGHGLAVDEGLAPGPFEQFLAERPAAPRRSSRARRCA